MKSKRIIVLGGNGQLGTSLVHSDQNDFEIIAFSRQDCDISREDDLEKIFELFPIYGIVNCAAITNLDYAELNKDKTKLINSDSVYRLGILARQFNIKLIHISSDAVFSNSFPIWNSIDALTKPSNYYGISKEMAEKGLLSLSYDGITIIRTSWLYSENRNQFLQNVLIKAKLGTSFGVVEDQHGQPTKANHLADFIVRFLKTQNSETLIHFARPEFISRFELARKFLNFMGLNDSLIYPISSEETGAIAPRPTFSLLEVREDTFRRYSNDKWFS